MPPTHQVSISSRWMLSRAFTSPSLPAHGGKGDSESERNQQHVRWAAGFCKLLTPTEMILPNPLRREPTGPSPPLSSPHLCCFDLPQASRNLLIRSASGVNTFYACISSPKNDLEEGKEGCKGGSCFFLYRPQATGKDGWTIFYNPSWGVS